MNISRKRIYIGGMTCVNCQNKIEQVLKKTPGVESVKVSYQKGTADVEMDLDWVTLEELQAVIRNLGYEVLRDQDIPKKKFARTAELLILIFLLYRLMQDSGILNLLVPSRLADTGMGYGMLFVVGLLTSVHCIAMCGGINLSQCIGHGQDEKKNGFTAFHPAVFYNLGRVISYTGTGFVLGFIGMFAGGTSQVGFPLFLQGILKIIAGIFMVIMGINMLGIFPYLRRFQPRIPQFLVRIVNRKKSGSNQPFAIGLLNGLMPCGPLQSMQIVALAAGDPFSGALSMLAFSLGTVPLMLGLGSFMTMLGKQFAKKVMEAGAILVVVLGLAMLSQGGNLSGLFYGTTYGMTYGVGENPAGQVSLKKTEITDTADPDMAKYGTADESGKSGTADESGVSEAGIQVIRSTLTAGRYPNITVTAGTPVRWIIDVPKGALNGCNYRMVLNAYGITHTFSVGENIIEFTPDKTGTIPYTCWMGMIRGNIFVTDEADDSQTRLGEELQGDIREDGSSGYRNSEYGDSEYDDDEYGNFGMGCCGGF